MNNWWDDEVHRARAEMLLASELAGPIDVHVVLHPMRSRLLEPGLTATVRLRASA
ncbi:hypothetical protein GA0070558_1587 [Micromonospora haikouensis]|uniref:Uncharacterized protein n=1 Tax=Micromonospora haikouensis TaxID=686309 RepID=A0A1C4YNB9_9ACTN|nr:hypothetical protein [Micromonospora haikouensis]SCF22137.1 hypothetical protein GA0070558_1587 [Micromonospora haikouensis]